MVEELEIIESAEETELEGVELLASFFDVAITPLEDGSIKATFIPKPNIADMFSDDTLAQIGSNVLNGYNADLDSMSDWSDFVETGLELVKQESQAKSTPAW